jgi:predicted HAD superfamily Cof-like phosphohydrolase
MSRERCVMCDHELADNSDLGTVPEGENGGLCWRLFNGRCDFPAVNWRERANRLHRFAINACQADVEVFHGVIGSPVLDRPTVPPMDRRQLRVRLIREEAIKELVPAILNGDLVEVADGIADAIYVLLGTAAEFGIDMGPIWSAVHESNMRKGGGPVDEHGKAQKPSGWEPPPIRALLREQGWTEGES